MVQVYIWKEKDFYTVEDLVGIMRMLRGENGCPWDKEQTHSSIRNNLLEEAYETADAIDRLDDTDMAEELGDLLLQIVFHCQMAEERGAYNLNAVADGICKKLIYRHPHIFSNVVVNNSDEVLNNWDKLKNKEKNMQSYSDTLNAVPKAFPSCLRAQKIQKRASKAGYDFKSLDDTVLKIEEELAELKQAISNNDFQSASDELGDLLFSVVNTARFLKTDAEQKLSDSTNKFVKRFSLAEELARSQNIDLADLSDEELDLLWNRAKEIEK
jgi:tetrapyrrole methylase family protein/MazG family protein